MARKSKPPSWDPPGGFLRTVQLLREEVPSFDEFPFSIPAIRTLDRLDLDPGVTFLVGENGSGKSTLIEAIAGAAGFNAEGGSKNFNFSTVDTSTELSRYLRLVRKVHRETDGFFLRAESFFNVATQVDELGVLRGYGGKSLHAQSHGESFMALATNRFLGHGLYLLDEPEAALSHTRQLALLRLIHEFVRSEHSQFVVATHSPILTACPGATILELSEEGIRQVQYEETHLYDTYRRFLLDRERVLRYLLED